MKNVFIVRMSNEGFAEYALTESKVVIGWAELEGLKKTKNNDSKVQRENIKKVLRDSGWYKSERAIGNVAGSIDRFIFSIKSGDYVIFPVYKGFYLGIVKDGNREQASFNELEKVNDRSWQWDVSWNLDSKGVPQKYSRTILSAKLHYSLKTQATCHQLAPNSDIELERSIIRKLGIDLNQKILEEENTYIESIKQEIQNTLNPNTFENFLMKILEKEGAIKVEKLPKNTPLMGDVDVVAVFSVNCMGNNKNDEFIYGYQCKHYVGETSEWPVIQLIDRIEDQQNDITYHKLFAVTSGYFSKKAIGIARDFNSKNEGDYPEICLVDGLDLARWLVELGLKGLEIYN